MPRSTCKCGSGRSRYWRGLIQGTIQYVGTESVPGAQVMVFKQDDQTIKVLFPENRWYLSQTILTAGPLSAQKTDYGADYAVLTIRCPVTTQGWKITGGVIVIKDQKGNELARVRFGPNNVVNGELVKEVRLEGLGSYPPEFQVRIEVVFERRETWRTPSQTITLTTSGTSTVRLARASVSGELKVKDISGLQATLVVSYSVTTENCDVESVTIELLRDGQMVDRKTVSSPQGSVEFTVTEEGEYQVRIIVECTRGVTAETLTNSVTVRFPSASVSGGLSIESVSSSSAVLKVDYSVTTEDCSVESVTVELLCNGHVIDTKTLNSPQDSVEFTVTQEGDYTARIIVQCTSGVITEAMTNTVTVRFPSASVSGKLSIKNLGASSAVLEVDYSIATENCGVNSVTIELLRDDQVVTTKTVNSPQGSIEFTVTEEGKYKAKIIARCTNGVTIETLTNAVVVQFPSTQTPAGIRFDLSILSPLAAIAGIMLAWQLLGQPVQTTSETVEAPTIPNKQVTAKEVQKEGVEQERKTTNVPETEKIKEGKELGKPLSELRSREEVEKVRGAVEVGESVRSENGSSRRRGGTTGVLVIGKYVTGIPGVLALLAGVCAVVGAALIFRCRR